MGYSGYKTIYVGQDVPGATKQGFIAEHRYVAEQILGRRLKPGEVVHHKDHCRTNNDPNNILVFHSREDHTRFHMGGSLELTDDGSYISKSFISDIPCAYCGKMFTPKSRNSKYCSTVCHQLATRKVARPSKKELKNLLMNFNLEQIGEIYGVSSNSIRKWCQGYKLPYKLREIKKLREREQAQIEKKETQKELKKRQKERDKIIKENTEE